MTQLVGGKPLISRPEERSRAPTMTLLGGFLGCLAYGMVNRMRRRNLLFGACACGAVWGHRSEKKQGGNGLSLRGGATRRQP
jgi:hypothetical protein